MPMTIDEKKDLVESLILQGTGVHQIAAQAHCSTSFVASVRRERNLPKRRGASVVKASKTPHSSNVPAIVDAQCEPVSPPVDERDTTITWYETRVAELQEHITDLSIENKRLRERLTS